MTGPAGADGASGALDIPGLTEVTSLSANYEFVTDAGVGNRRVSMPAVADHLAGTGLQGNADGSISIDGGIVQSLDAGRGIDINDPSTDSPEVALDLSELLTTSTIGTSDSLAVSINSNDENRLISKHDFAVSPSLTAPRSPCRAASYRPREARPAP